MVCSKRKNMSVWVWVSRSFEGHSMHQRNPIATTIGRNRNTESSKRPHVQVEKSTLLHTRATTMLLLLLVHTHITITKATTHPPNNQPTTSSDRQANSRHCYRTLITASATSFRVAALRQVLGSQLIWTKGILLHCTVAFLLWLPISAFVFL